MAWWESNRPAAATLFLDELDAILQRPGTMPRSGKPYERAEMSSMYRLLMPRTRYHVYYRIEGESMTVHVHAVWHSSRGTPPGMR